MRGAAEKGLPHFVSETAVNDGLSEFPGDGVNAN